MTAQEWDSWRQNLLCPQLHWACLDGGSGYWPVLKRADTTWSFSECTGDGLKLRRVCVAENASLAWSDWHRAGGPGTVHIQPTVEAWL